MADDDKQIIIDEDWKSQVQREKEQAEAAADEAPEAGEPGEEAEMPDPSSFAGFVGTLMTQAMYALGVIAPEGQEQVMVHLDQAKFLMDTLEMLKEKTQGNLEPEEEGMLTEALGELQRIYMIRFQQIQEQAMQESGIDLSNPQPNA